MEFPKIQSPKTKELLKFLPKDISKIRISNISYWKNDFSYEKQMIEKTLKIIL